MMKVTMLKTTKKDGRWYTGGNHYDVPDKVAKALIENNTAVKFGEAPAPRDPNRLELRPEQEAKLERDTETTEDHDKPEDFEGDTRHDHPDIPEDEEEVVEEDPETKKPRRVRRKKKR